MAKTASGGDEREPHKFEDPYKVPKPKQAWDDYARRRAQEFIAFHFNDRRPPAANEPNPQPYDGKTSSKPLAAWYKAKNMKEPKGY